MRVARSWAWVLALLAAGCGATTPRAEARPAPRVVHAMPPPTAADEAAGLAFTQIVLTDDELASLAIGAGPRGPTMVVQLTDLVDRVEAAFATAEQLAARFDPVLAMGSPRWSVAAYVRQARIFDDLASTIVHLRHPLSEDIEDRITGEPTEVRLEVEDQVDDRIHDALRPRVEALACLAIVRYLRATMTARSASISNEVTDEAVTRLAAHPQALVVACAALEHERDPEFPAHVAFEP